MDPQPKTTVVVLGGYGNFGRRISRLLAQDANLHVIIAGRSEKKAQDLLKLLKINNPSATLSAQALDWQQADFSQLLKATNAKILIHTAGPFQGQQYQVANACIEQSIHYLDLSDGREFVNNIVELDEKAKKQQVAIISGASSVPGISSCVVEQFAPKFGILREIDIGIAPANKMDRGEALMKSILGYTGKPFLRLDKGRWITVYGWQDAHRHYYGDNLGLRWHANLDVPDLDLYPKKYPTLNTVAFYAGLEVPFLHLAMWHMSWLSRAKIIRNWSFFHKSILAMSRWFKNFGTESGGMHVRLRGSSLRYQPLEINWTVVAEKGHGPYLPIVPCLILVKKLIDGEVEPGARPCYGMFSLEEFEKAISSWSIYSTVEEKEI